MSKCTYSGIRLQFWTRTEYTLHTLQLPVFSEYRSSRVSILKKWYPSTPVLSVCLITNCALLTVAFLLPLPEAFISSTLSFVHFIELHAVQPSLFLKPPLHVVEQFLLQSRQSQSRQLLVMKIKLDTGTTNFK